MDNKDVPYIVYEATQARNERTVKRLIIVIIITIALLFISNAVWLWAWSSYDYSSATEENQVDLSTDGGGDANYIGNDGVINNGESESSESGKNTDSQEKER